MPSQTRNPTAAATANDGTTTAAWSNLSNVYASDDTYASILTTETTVYLVQLVSGGDRFNEPRGGDAVPTADAFLSWGGPSDDWGDAANLTPDRVNASHFGLVFVPGSGSGYTRSLTATGFGFSIPSDATITGVTAEVECSRTTGKGAVVRVDHMRLTVHYTEAGGGAGDQQQFLAGSLAGWL